MNMCNYYVLTKNLKQMFKEMEMLTTLIWSLYTEYLYQISKLYLIICTIKIVIKKEKQPTVLD
jgi:hypothetical protein